MQVFMVGGAVRDQLMGKDPKDLDFVVVGSTAAEMLSLGFEQVGKDFPVFLHPVLRHEYALARQERSTGAGHGDFEFVVDNVTLEDDLARRDLTINAIAIAEDGSKQIIDPFNGRSDIKNRILRHVTDEGFVEDPLRVLRVARFLSQFPAFSVARETTKLIKKMVADGMLAHLTAERVGNEMIKALNARHPSRFFVYLNMVGALEVLMPELHALTKVPAGPYDHHPEGDAFVHTMMVLDQATEVGQLEVRFGALVHDLGKGNSFVDKLPSHHGHEQRGVPLTRALGERLRLPAALIEIGELVAAYHTHVHNAFKLNAKTVADMVVALRVQQRPQRIDYLIEVSTADARGRGSFFQNDPYPNRHLMHVMLNAGAQVKASTLWTDEQIQTMKPQQIQDGIRKARIAKIEQAKRDFMEGFNS